MRISDWSSDVCSSDLRDAAAVRHRLGRPTRTRQHPRPPKHPDRRPAVRRRRVAAGRRKPGASAHHPNRWEASAMSDIQNNDGREEEVARDVQPSTSADALRLRPAPPRVTRLSRKVLAGLGVVAGLGIGGALIRSEEHPSELQSLMRISYAVFCLKKKNNTKNAFYINKLRRTSHIQHQQTRM